MSSNLFIGIVVMKPEGMPELPNATYRSFERLANWTTAEGYESWLFTDEKDPDTGKRNPLTGDNLRDKIRDHNTQGDGLYARHRIWVYFAGHGFGNGNDQVWALSRGRTHYEDRINVNGMIAVLQHYQPGHICVFSDACAEAVFMAGGDSPVFPNPDHVPGPVNTDLDRFFAADKGEGTYSDAGGPKFSQFVAEALLNDPVPDGALDGYHFKASQVRAVTNKSLKDYVEPRLRAWAEGRNKIVVPHIVPGLSDPNHIYRVINDGGSIPPAPPVRNTSETRDVVGRSLRSRDSSEWISALRRNRLVGKSARRAARDYLDGFPKFAVTDRDALLPPRRHLNPPVSYPRITDARSVLIGFGWEGVAPDDVNGTALVRLRDRSILVPEFEGFTTMILMSAQGDGQFRTGIGAVRPVDDISRPQTYGGVLLRRITEPQNDSHTLNLIARYARNRILEDPLVPLALAYFYDTIAQRGAIADLIEELAAHGGQIAADLAILAGLPISYDTEARQLVCRGHKLATQLPILRRGWSQMLSSYGTGIFADLSALAAHLDVAPYAQFTRMEDHRRIAAWLSAHFTAFPRAQLMTTED